MNTVAFILNDRTSELEVHGTRAIQEVLHHLRSGKGGEVMGQTIRVMPSFHSSEDRLFLAGGNRIFELSKEAFNGNPSRREDVIRALAEAGIEARFTDSKA